MHPTIFLASLTWGDDYLRWTFEFLIILWLSVNFCSVEIRKIFTVTFFIPNDEYLFVFSSNGWFIWPFFCLTVSLFEPLLWGTLSTFPNVPQNKSYLVYHGYWLYCTVRGSWKKKSPLNMKIPKRSLKAFNFLFTFEHRDAG